MRRPIASNVSCPIRITREREIQPGGHLTAQTPIGAIDIARPNGCSHSLLAKESGSCQQKDPLPVRRRSPVLLDSKSMSERKYVRIFGSVANRNLLVAENRVAPMRPVFLGLCAVEPERIPSLRKQLADQVIPIEIARLADSSSRTREHSARRNVWRSSSWKFCAFVSNMSPHR